MLKHLRAQSTINALGRNVFHFNKNIFGNIQRFFTTRWRLSGIITLQVEEVDFKMATYCDDHLVDELYYQKEHEKFELELFSALAESSKVIFDIGSNTGVYSLLASKTNPTSRILALEPYKPNFDRLNLNLQINQIKNVEAINKAVGAEKGILNLTVPVDGRLSTVSSLNGSFTRKFHPEEVTYTEVPVEIISLNDYCSTMETVDLVKIDVESFEMEVFKGAFQFFQKFRPTIFCEIFVDEERITFFTNHLKDLNYHIYSILPEGLLRLEKLENNGCRNFLLSQGKTENVFIHKEAVKSVIPKLIKPSLYLKSDVGIT